MRIKRILTQFVKYSTTTLLGTATDTFVLWLFSARILGESHFEQYILSPMISFECAVIVNYTTAFFYVWKDRISKHTFRSFLSHFWKYNLTCISAFIVKMLILNAIAVAFKLDPVICNLLALCVSGLLNFTINEFVIFRKKEEKQKELDN